MINRQKFELIIFAVVSIGIGITGAFSLNEDIKRALDSESTRLEFTVKMVSTDLELTLQAVDLALKGINRNNPNTFLNSAQPLLLQNLQSVSEAMPGVRGINIVNREGIITASFPRYLIGHNASNRYFYTAPKNRPSSSLYLSPPYLSVHNDIVVSATRIILDKNGMFNGSVSAILDPGYFDIRIHSFLFGPDVKSWIVDLKNNNFVTASALGYADKAKDSWYDFIIPIRYASTISSQHIIRSDQSNYDNGLVVGISRSSKSIIYPILKEIKFSFLFFIFLNITCFGTIVFFQAKRKKEFNEIEKQKAFKAQADALQISESRFRALIEEAPVAISITRKGRFLYCNSKYSELHGYSCPEELIGLHWKYLISNSDVEISSDKIHRIIADFPTDLQFEVNGIGKENQIVPILISTARIALHDGDVTLIFAQDISAQKRAELSALTARDVAEAANRSKAEFLANMSHEIRTPLNAILGFTYLLEKLDIDSDAQQLLKNIRIAGKSLLGIINDILDMSKIDAGALIIESASLNLQEVLDNVAALMAGASIDRPVQLIVNPLPDGLSNIIGDALRLEQILVNLTNNAIKFTFQGYVELSIKLNRNDKGEDFLLFAVKDTGIGIAEEIQKTIFSPFSQADTSTTRRFGGSGLGLAICKKMVEMMNGEIGLISTPKIGSTFWFSLPLRVVTNDEIQCHGIVPINAVISARDSKVLLNLGATSSALGWNVSLFDSPQSAMMQIFKNYDSQNNNQKSIRMVFFLEWEKNSAECIAISRAIKQILPDDECSIVLVASALNEEVYDDKLENIFDSLLIKPFTTSTLNNAAISALRKKNIKPTGGTSVISGDEELRGICILVVDDSDINRDVAERILTRHGAEVHLAEDGKSAITWLLAHPTVAHVVLMDLQMPILDGIEATRQIRNIKILENLPIVALTAGAFQSHREAALSAGMTDFIAKPFDVPIVINLILDITRRLANKHSNNIKKLDAALGQENSSKSEQVALDIRRGVEIWGDMETFLFYLKNFVKDHHSVMLEIQSQMSKEDIRSASQILHKLAGTSSSLALLDLAAKCKNAEVLFNDKSSNRNRLVEFSNEINDAILFAVKQAEEAFASNKKIS